jgi:hypothetical protein
MIPRSANHPTFRPSRAWSMVVGTMFVDIFTAPKLEFWVLMSTYKGAYVEILYISHLEPISLSLALPRYNWGLISGYATPNSWLSLWGTGVTGRMLCWMNLVRTFPYLPVCLVCRLRRYPLPAHRFVQLNLLGFSYDLPLV